MEMIRPALNDHLCDLLDQLVAMRRELSRDLFDGPDLPEPLTNQLQRVGVELDVTIKELKTLIQVPAVLSSRPVFGPF